MLIPATHSCIQMSLLAMLLACLQLRKRELQQQQQQAGTSAAAAPKQEAPQQPLESGKQGRKRKRKSGER